VINLIKLTNSSKQPLGVYGQPYSP
jgi:hypothetical protein